VSTNRGKKCFWKVFKYTENVVWSNHSWPNGINAGNNDVDICGCDDDENDENNEYQL
jgi:hypothetical protein